MSLPRCFAICCLVCCGVCTSISRAALGPERVFVVVNQRSWASRTIANHFVRLNRIPQSHVFALDWGGSVVSTSLQEFRERLLRPTFDELRRRGLSGQVDCIAYSSDFPYRIVFKRDLPAGDKDRFPVGSLTGLTFLYQQLNAPDAAYRSPAANWYGNARGDRTAAFSSRIGWTAQGRPDPSAQRRYMLSAMLGYVSGRGNSYEHVIKYLSRSRLASSTHPDGTIYFVTNDDVRTKVRSPRFDQVKAQLTRLGVRTETVKGGGYPLGKKDVQGAVFGSSYFIWSKSGSRILPGAICDNLTSFGGILDDSGTQIALTEFLQHGAAGASGTVVEPYALPQKFPDPAIHVYYAKGLSLVESFYRATRSPYQILLVGDPLCHPWGTAVRVEVDGLGETDEVAGQLFLRPSVASPHAIGRYELYVDGRLVSECVDGQQFRVDTNVFPDGFHEFRVVAVLRDVAQSTSRWIGWKNVQNRGHTCNAELPHGRSVAFGEQVLLTVSGSSPMSYHIFHQRRKLSLSTTRELLRVNSTDLGLGPNTLQIVGITADGAKVFAKPVTVYVKPPRELQSQTRLQARPFMLLESDGASARLDTRKLNWLDKNGIGEGEPFEVKGDLRAKVSGVHQLQVYFAGRMTAHVDGSRVLDAWHPKLQRQEVPLTLAKGYHALRISGTSSDTSTCEIRFGFRGAKKLVAPKED